MLRLMGPRGIVRVLGLAASLSTAAWAEAPAVHPEPASHPPNDAIFAQYRVHAQAMRQARYGRAIGFGTVGLGAVSTAAFLPAGSAQMYLAIGGVGALTAALFNVVAPSYAEWLSGELDRGGCCRTAASLHEHWRIEARRAALTRRVFGFGAISLGALHAVGGAVALALDDSTSATADNQETAAVFFVAAGALVGAGSVLVLTPSASERSLAQYEAGQLRVSGFGVAPVSGGAALSMTGVF